MVAVERHERREHAVPGARVARDEHQFLPLLARVRVERLLYRLELLGSLGELHPQAILVEDEDRTLDGEHDEVERQLAQAPHDGRLARFEPVQFDRRVVDLVERTAESMGLSAMRMPSGAGHDAQMLARVCPTGMIFVPSIAGLSHNPAERTDPADLEAGANVLLHCLVALAARDGGVID